MNRFRDLVSWTRILATVVLLGLLPAGPARADEPGQVVKPQSPAVVDGKLMGAGSDVFRALDPSRPAPPAGNVPSAPLPVPQTDGRDMMRTVQTVALYSLVWLAPMGALMLTAFVRINIVLVLLRQALGSPQVPGNQVLTALAMMLTVLVMRPVGERTYHEAIVPCMSGKLTMTAAWTAGSSPIKEFMVDQIVKTKHQDYLWSLHHYSSGTKAEELRAEYYAHEFPFRVVAPAYLLSELTTALVIGFFVYLPFLVVDLVVSAVLAAMGLYMLPPTLVAMPLKLIVFVLADGWMLVASMLLSSFGVVAP